MNFHDEIKFLIRKIESFDGITDHDGSQEALLEGLNGDLERLTEGTLSTRIWVVNNEIHCVVLYPNKFLIRLFSE